MSTSIKDQIRAHLETLGYQIKTTDKGSLVAEHEINLNILVQELDFANLFSSYFPVSDDGKLDPARLHAIVNSLNQTATVCRFYFDSELDFIVEACYPYVYDQAEFGQFIAYLNRDLNSIADDALGLRELLV